MNRFLISTTLALLAPAAIAQTCFDGDFGVVIAENNFFSFQDWVSPMLPIGFAFPIAGTSYTDIHVSDHGLAFLSNGGVPVPPASQDPVLYTPTLGNFADGSPKVCALYTDVIFMPGTKIWLKSSATKCTVTWQDVQNFGIPGRFSFQMTLFPSGDVRIVYGPGCTNASIFGGVSEYCIVGISPGGGVTLPAPVDLAAGGGTTATTVFEQWTTPNSFDIAANTLLLTASAPAGYGFANLGPAANCASESINSNGSACGGFLDCVGRPSFGNADFALQLSLFSTPTFVAYLGFGSVGYPAPGITLGGIGMPGCAAYSNLDLGYFAVPLTNGGGVYPLPIPNTTLLVGATLAAQCFAVGNTPLGIGASNGRDLVIGYGY